MSNGEFVCGACFGDQGIKDFCMSHAESTECDFCGSISNEPIAAPLTDVIAHINDCIHRHFDDPANAGLPYESAEGGWQGTTYDTNEVFEEIGLDFRNKSGDRLFNAVTDGLDCDLWCEVDPFGLSLDKTLLFSWKQFCDVIKHFRRYFFIYEERKAKNYINDELLSPAKTLQMIFSCAQEAGAFIVLPAGTKVYRARYQSPSKVYRTAGELGPPPLDRAIQTNRMSPPGIVMTYVAEDCETALAETANRSGIYAVGEFVNDHDLLILDLTRLPAIPSVFAELPDSLEHDPRPKLIFLHKINREISRPIARDDRVHIEYVPTQVVTEYVRTVVRINGRKVDGIRYASSRRCAGASLVIFADQSNLVLEANEWCSDYRAGDRWLRLIRVDEIKVTKGKIRKWITTG